MTWLFAKQNLHRVQHPQQRGRGCARSWRDPNWLKGYSTPCSILLSNKNGGEGFSGDCGLLVGSIYWLPLHHLPWRVFFTIFFPFLIKLSLSWFLRLWWFLFGFFLSFLSFAFLVPCLTLGVHLPTTNMFLVYLHFWMNFTKCSPLRRFKT